MVALSSLAAIYYICIIAWAVYMFFASMRSTLPWDKCDFGDWANYRCNMKTIPNCVRNGTETFIKAVDGLCYNVSASAEYQMEPCPGLTNSTSQCANFTEIPERNIDTVVGQWNGTLAEKNEVGAELSSHQYFFYSVLGQTEGYDTENIGVPNWGLVLSLLLAWIMVFFSLINGIKTTGKVVYFTAIFPYLVLLALIIRGCTLPGAYEGIKFYIADPDFSKMADAKTWFAAANQLV